MNYTEALKILKLNENCTEIEIKKAYRKEAKNHHPDRGGSAENMKRINEAKEVLDNWIKTRSNKTQQSYSNYNNYKQSRNYDNRQSENYKKSWAGFDFDFDNLNKEFGKKVKQEEAVNKTTGNKTCKIEINRDEFESFRNMLNKAYKICTKENNKIVMSKRITLLAMGFIIYLILFATVTKLGNLMNINYGAVYIINMFIGLFVTYRTMIHIIRCKYQIDYNTVTISYKYDTLDKVLKYGIRYNGKSFGHFVLFKNVEEQNVINFRNIWEILADSYGVYLQVENYTIDYWEKTKLTFGYSDTIFTIRSNNEMAYSQLNSHGAYCIILPGMFIIVDNSSLDIITMNSMSLDVKDKIGYETKYTNLWKYIAMFKSCDNRIINLYYYKTITNIDNLIL